MRQRGIAAFSSTEKCCNSPPFFTSVTLHCWFSASPSAAAVVPLLRCRWFSAPRVGHLITPKLGWNCSPLTAARCSLTHIHSLKLLPTLSSVLAPPHIDWRTTQLLADNPEPCNGSQCAPKNAQRMLDQSPTLALCRLAGHPPSGQIMYCDATNRFLVLGVWYMACAGR